MNDDEKTAIRIECEVAIEDCQALIAALAGPLEDYQDWDYFKDKTENIGYRLGSIDAPGEDFS